tara:strand:+ start:548 stop:1009 length:462 start_codon:yes stop_codon:yes gene_type:complete
MTFRNGQFEGHGYDLWRTPSYIIQDLWEEFGLSMFDPCPSDYDGSFDGLEIEWGKVNFVNPPYSKMKEWIAKCHEEWKKGKTVILLIPPRTCTSYWHEYIEGNAEIRFIKGRVRFIDGRNPNAKPKPAPFPSVLVIFHANRIPKLFFQKMVEI